MRKSLADLLCPSFSFYRSIGELARTVQSFLLSGSEYRDKGRWGSSGPREVLSGYGGCVNCYDHNWDSSRLTSLKYLLSKEPRPPADWLMCHDGLYHALLQSLCCNRPAFLRWRDMHNIHLHMDLKFPMAYQNQASEQKAWVEFISLDGFCINVKTLNPCHRGVNVLCEPKLVVSDRAIWIECNVTDRREFREFCGSTWDLGFLLNRKARKGAKFPVPVWRPQRETFAEYISRAVAAYKSIDETHYGQLS